MNNERILLKKIICLILPMSEKNLNIFFMIAVFYIGKYTWGILR
jgi:hypothetical protein